MSKPASIDPRQTDLIDLSVRLISPLVILWIRPFGIMTPGFLPNLVVAVLVSFGAAGCLWFYVERRFDPFRGLMTSNPPAPKGLLLGAGAGIAVLFVLSRILGVPASGQRFQWDDSMLGVAIVLLASVYVAAAVAIWTGDRAVTPVAPTPGQAAIGKPGGPDQAPCGHGSAGLAGRRTGRLRTRRGQRAFAQHRPAGSQVDRLECLGTLRRPGRGHARAHRSDRRGPRCRRPGPRSSRRAGSGKRGALLARHQGSAQGRQSGRRRPRRLEVADHARSAAPRGDRERPGRLAGHGIPRSSLSRSWAGVWTATWRKSRPGSGPRIWRACRG